MEDNYSMKKAALINASGKYTTIILQLIVNAILSRLLMPDDYGIVAIITVFSTFFLTLSDMGFSTAIIQCKDLKKKEMNNIFSFTLIVACVLVGLFSIISYIVGIIYKDNIYFELGVLLNIALFFNTLNMVPNGIMNKEKKFISITIRTIVSCIISAILSISLALCGFRYYVIVIQTVVTSVIIFVWNYIQTKPKFDFDKCICSVKRVLNYSSFQFAFNVVNYFSRNLDNLLTGKFLGNTELGYYNKAYTLMLYPVNNLAGVITPVIHPFLSDYQSQKEKIYTKYIKLVKFLFVVAAFVAPVCYLAAYEIIEILFGNQWKSSVKCFKLLSLAVLPQFVGAPIGAIYQSLGKTKLLFINAIVNTIITVICILIGVLVGKNIVFLSLCVTIAYLIHFFTTNSMLIYYGFHNSFFKFLRELTTELVIVGSVFLAAFIYTLNIEEIFVSLLVKGIYLGIVYLVVLFISKDYKIIVEILKK